MACLKLIKCFVTYRICSSKLSTTAILLVNDPLESRFVAKIFRKNQRKDRNIEGFSIFEMNIPKPARRKSKHQSLAKPIMKEDNPKLKQSERLLHENVSHIIQSGQIGITVPISKVRLIRDFSQLNVYWESTGDARQDKKIQNTLNSRTKSLRHLLLTNQDSGYVPTISFIKDDSYIKEKQFEEYIKNLDTGYQEDTGTRDSTETQNGKPVDTMDMEDTLAKLYSQNVYNVPHDLLMKKVMNSKLKTKPEVKEDEEEVEIRSGMTHLDGANRGKGVKQYSKLLGVYPKKKQPKLEGNLAHLVPDILKSLEVERELAEQKDEFVVPGLDYFNREIFRKRVQALEEKENEDDFEYDIESDKNSFTD